MVTVYTKGNCPQCVMTKRALAQKGISFVEVDVSTDDAAKNLLADMGYRQVPVVVTPAEHWGGFRPDRLAGL